MIVGFRPCWALIGMRPGARRPNSSREYIYLYDALSQGRHLRLFDHADLEYGMFPGFRRRAWRTDLLGKTSC